MEQTLQERIKEKFIMSEVQAPVNTKVLFVDHGITVDGVKMIHLAKVDDVLDFIQSELSKKDEETYSYGNFELKQDEETGRLYWWGAEDGWKDPTEVGEDGTLILKAEHFKVGTVLTMREPFSLDALSTEGKETHGQ